MLFLILAPTWWFSPIEPLFMAYPAPGIPTIWRALDKYSESSSDLSPRSLQRLFKQYVGVNPKWVIRLYRLQNVAEMLEGLDHQDVLELAMDMGYYDQSHFIRDFKAVIGKTPEVYIKER